MSLPVRSEREWWRDAVTYQIYIRSFADANGDGAGDVEGIRSRLPYLKQLGVDAIWITPWYPSPQKDHGYDVANYFDIEPTYGNLDHAQLLINEAHSMGIKILIDIVPNHSSDQHEWFQQALRAAPGSQERARYIFRDGKGEHGELPPNDWQSVFGGIAWKRVPEANGELGQWYLHLFADEQPDFNWDNPEVRQHFEQILNFWLMRGVDGFRIDVAHGMIKAAGLPDVKEFKTGLLDADARPYWNQPGVHEIYRSWRKIFNNYPGDRMGVAEAWVPAESLPLYLRPDELANSFNFQFLNSKWSAKSFRKSIKNTFKVLGGTSAPASWVLENHDVTRSTVRFDQGLTGGGADGNKSRYGNPKKFDIHRGTRRARAAALLMLALPGGAYIYQGEELALPEVMEMPNDRRQDPVWRMSGYRDYGRDGCRVPLPWEEGASGAHGFSGNAALRPEEAWLPQPAKWGRYSVQVQERDENSTLWLYRRALKIRKEEPGLGDGEFNWLESDKDVIAFERPGGFQCWINFGKKTKLPKGATVLISSAPIDGRKLPKDAAVWLRV
jgi:alpha-glucosidase